MKTEKYVCIVMINAFFLVFSLLINYYFENDLKIKI